MDSSFNKCEFLKFLVTFEEMSRKLGPDKSCIELVFEHQGKLPAVRLTRNLTGASLKQSKKFVEVLCENKYRLEI